MPKLLDQFRGCMVGALVGDCLGANFENLHQNLVPVELINRFLEKINQEEFSETQRYTDDTAMARQIAKSFIATKSFDYKDIASRFTEDFHLQPWRGYGGSVVDVFKKLKENCSDPFLPASQQFNGSGSYGNGAGMRAHPVALACHGLDTENTILNAVNVGRITHAHVQGIGGGVLQTLAVQQALSCESAEAILENVKRDLKVFEAQRNNQDFSQKLELVEEFIDRPGSQ